MRRSQSASISKSSNDFNNTQLTTSSRSVRTKWGTRTTSSFDKEVYSRSTGALVGQTHSLKHDVSIDSNMGLISSAFGFLFGILLLINLFGLLSGTAEYRGLEWLLNVLSNAPEIPTGWLVEWGSRSIDASSWGAFSFIAVFLNDFSAALNVIAFLGVGILNLLTFVLYIVSQFFFVGL